MRTCLLVSAQTVRNLVSFSWSTYYHVFHIFVLSVGDFTVSNTLLASAEVPSSVPWMRRLCVTFGETFESDELPSFMSYGTEPSLLGKIQDQGPEPAVTTFWSTNQSRTLSVSV